MLSRLTMTSVFGFCAALLTAHPTLAQSHDQLAETCENQQGTTPLNQVVTACTRLIESGSEAPPILALDYMNRGNAYDDSNQGPLALADYNRAVQLDPQNGETYYNRALYYQRQGDGDRALADYNQTIRLIPQEAAALVHRGEIYTQRHDVRAFDDFNLAIQISPKNPAAWYARGVAYATQGNEARALTDFDQTIALEPRNPFGWANRCQALGALGQRLDQALNDCNEALKIAPQDAITLSSRGLVRLRKGDNAGAKGDYEAALRIDPNRALAQYGRGIAQVRLGQTAAGQADVAAATTKDAGLPNVFKGWGLTP